MILTMVLTVLLFGGTRLMAQDLSNKPSETQTTPDEEKSKEEGSLAKTNENEEGSENADDTAKDTKEDNNGAVLPKGSDNPDLNKTATENNNENLVKEAPKTKAEGAKTLGEETKTEEQVKAKEANKANEKSNGVEDGGQAPQANPSTNGTTDPNPKPNPKPNPEEKPTKPQVDTKTDKDLSDLQAEINAEKDPKKKAALQKEYNEKYLKKLEDTGKNKLDPDVAKSFNDEKRIKIYDEIQEQYDKIKKAKLDGSLKQADIDKLNELLGTFNPPRKLSDTETKVLEELHKEPYIPRVEKDKGNKFKNYEEAKKALEDALNPENEAKTEEELKELFDKFNEAKNALKAAINSSDPNEKIIPKFTNDKGPEIKLFPLDGVKPGDEMKEKTYYLPDNTDMHLLVQFNKDAQANGEKQALTFTIKPVDAGVKLSEYEVKKLVFLNHSDKAENIEVKLNPDGSYTFTSDVEFGVAQLRFNTKGFEAAFHKGFKLVMEAGNIKKEVNFLITKKGYDDADIGSIGIDERENVPTIDAGDTNNNIVDENTKKVFDVFTMIKKTDAYIDEVFINSGSGKSQELSSVDIKIKLPEYNGNFAKYIHDSGLAYQDNGGGTYTLKLQMKDFGGNLVKGEDGNLYLKGAEGKAIGQPLSGNDLKNYILDNGKEKYYVDANGVKHKLNTKEYYEVKDDNGNIIYVLEDGKLHKKNSNQVDEWVKELKNGKLVKDGITYIFEDGKLLSYKSEEDVYEGNVSNKDEVAAPEVTPTYEGKQVIVTEGSNKNYAGTIIENGIFDKDGKKYLGKNISENDNGYKGYEVAYIDETGKLVKTSSLPPVYNAIFKNEYIQEGMTFKKDYTLIDKFGKVITDVTITKSGEKYTFAKKGEDPKETDGTNIKIAEENQKFIDKDNKVLDKKGRDAIVGKYYFDGKKFVEIKDNDKGLKGKKYYTDYKTMKMEFKKTYSYDKDGQITPINENTKIYHGSTELENYVKVDGKTYEKKSIGGIDYYINIDPKNNDEILSENTITRIVQILKIKGENSEIEKVTDETSIYEAVSKSKFKIKFPGFLAGDKILYNIHADIKAYYKAPDSNKKELKDISIFKDENDKPIEKDSEKDKGKSIDKYFKLKNSEKSQGSFFKNPPKELEKNPDYNFFNVFYRDEDYRDRDDYIKSLLKLKEDEDKKSTEKGSEPAKKEDKKAIEAERKRQAELKAKLEILQKIQSELARLYDGAKFALAKDGSLVILDKKGEVAKDITRKLLWEVGFNNPSGALFPENKDNTIVITDSNMDNRLVYDEIIVNDKKETWENAKKAWEAGEAEKKEKDKNYKEEKFPGNEEYFFIDKIENIQLGVNSSYKDKVFTYLGENFTLRSEEILAALEYKEPEKKNITDANGKGIKDCYYVYENKKHFIEKNGIKFEITRDTDKHQIRIKVMKAFYKKVENKDNKFESPVQIAYKEKTKELLGLANVIKTDSKENLKTDFDKLIEKMYPNGSDCDKTLKKKFEEIVKSLKDNDEKLKDKLEAIKKAIVAEVEKAVLGYLDESKGDYKFDDMSFNAIRIKFKSGLSIGGAMEKVKTKKLGITSVIVPDIDIPYTDEFGKPLTNKGKYIYEAIKKIQTKKNLNDDQFNSSMENEDFYREVMKAAYDKVNKRINDKEIAIKDLVIFDEKAKYGEGRFKVIAGNELSFDDLAIDGIALKDKYGQGINPFYIGDKDEAGNVKSLKNKVSPELQKKDAYKELAKRPIDIAAYYMNSKGYNRTFYENKAEFFILSENKSAGLFENKSEWKEKICYHGILGHCVENAGKTTDIDEFKNATKGLIAMEAKNKFKIDYTPSPKTPDEEHPGVDKKSDTSVVDISKEINKKVDFTINVTVDKMNRDQKELSDALKEDSKKSDPVEYNKNGYYEYKNGLIIDILPDIFELDKDTKIELEINEKALKANGANKNIDMKKFKDGIEHVYTEDVKTYLKELQNKNAKKYKVLLEALGGDIDKIKDGQRVVLVWFNETFEAPHGEKNQFTLKLSNLILNNEKYRELEKNNNNGQDYTNRSGFGDTAKFWFGEKTITVTDGHSGNVNKYLQIYDKNGKELDEKTASEWFKGNVTLKFGDKFNYKIKYHKISEIIDTGLATTNADWDLDDIFDKAEKNGLRPVLRDYVKAPEGFEVLYKIGEGDYKKASEVSKEELAKVTSIKITSGIVGFPANATREFILPMMIPELDAKIENGELIYIGTDGKKHEFGKAEEFFNLKNLKDKDKKMYFENTVDKSNTVTVYLEKEAFIKVFKEFLDANGEKLKDLNNLEAKFDVYQIAEENGKKTRIKLDKQLIANSENDFTDMIDHLPIFKKTTTIDEKGNVKVEEVKYEYELEEAAMPGFESKVYKLEDSDKLGFVWQATNTEKAETPPEYPGENPKNVTVTIRVNKVWQVLNNGATPSIQVELYANGKATGKIITLGADGSWSASFEDLPSKDANGKEIIYTVREIGESNELTKIDDRTFEVIYTGNLKDGFTIINKEIPPEEPKDEKPKDKKEPKKHKPNDEEGRDRTPKKNRIPKTGVNEDLGAIYFAFVLLLGLVFIKKRYLVK